MPAGGSALLAQLRGGPFEFGRALVKRCDSTRKGLGLGVGDREIRGVAFSIPELLPLAFARLDIEPAVKECGGAVTINRAPHDGRFDFLQPSWGPAKSHRGRFPLGVRQIKTSGRSG